LWRHDMTPARMAAAMTTRPPAAGALSALSFDGAQVAATHIALVLAEAAAQKGKIDA
jgi:hypothetical protein